VLIVVPIAAAQSQGIAVTLSPAQGPAGTFFIIYITNYALDDTTFTVTFGSATLQDIYTGPTDTSGSGGEYVPNVAPGQYTITVTGSFGESGTATFAVTSGSASTSPPVSSSPAPYQSPTTTYSGTGGVLPYSYPTASPATGGGGFWSPLAIGVVAVVVALACFMTVVFVRRGGGGGGAARRYREERERERESYRSTSLPENAAPYSPGYGAQPPQQTPAYRYGSSTQSSVPYYRARYAPPSSSTYRSRYSAPPLNPTMPPRAAQAPVSSAPPMRTKVCKHCHRDVREDFSICPYCFKKM
jgi:hypothetical protein